MTVPDKCRPDKFWPDGTPCADCGHVPVSATWSMPIEHGGKGETYEEPLCGQCAEVRDLTFIGSGGRISTWKH